MRVLRKIFAVYGILLFLLVLAFGIPVMLFNMAVVPGERALKRNISFLHHRIGPLVLMLMGIRLRISGLEQVDPGKSYVIIGNHSSALDFVINAPAFPGIFRYLAKDELRKIPVLGWVVKKICLTVDRRSAISRARSVVGLRQQLAVGWSIFIYPEGGRNRTDELLAPFYDGAFRIAIQTGAPLLVQTIVNIRDISSTVSAFDLWPGVLRIAWDGPIETAGMTSEDLPALKEQVSQIMLGHLKKNKSIHYGILQEHP